MFSGCNFAFNDLHKVIISDTNINKVFHWQDVMEIYNF